MQWIDITIEQPTVSGKYVVKTKTRMDNVHRLDAHCSVEMVKGNLKATFHVSNQIVTHWLKEDESFTAEDVKQFGLFLGDNLKKFKNKSIDELFKLFIS